jgi:hypothetical protein
VVEDTLDRRAAARRGPVSFSFAAEFERVIFRFIGAVWTDRGPDCLCLGAALKCASSPEGFDGAGLPPTDRGPVLCLGAFLKCAEISIDSEASFGDGREVDALGRFGVSFGDDASPGSFELPEDGDSVLL